MHRDQAWASRMPAAENGPIVVLAGAQFDRRLDRSTNPAYRAAEIEYRSLTRAT
jgi:hypothetical protein